MSRLREGEQGRELHEVLVMVSGIEHVGKALELPRARVDTSVPAPPIEMGRQGRASAGDCFDDEPAAADEVITQIVAAHAIPGVLS